MKYLVFISIFLVSCSTYKTSIVQQPESLSRCLKTQLNPTADNGGTWTVEQQPPGTVPLTLTGDNPCVDLANHGCGLYVFKYTVTSTTCNGCTKSTTYNVNYSLTIVATSNCN